MVIIHHDKKLFINALFMTSNAPELKELLGLFNGKGKPERSVFNTRSREIFKVAPEAP